MYADPRVSAGTTTFSLKQGAKGVTRVDMAGVVVAGGGKLCCDVEESELAKGMCRTACAWKRWAGTYMELGSSSQAKSYCIN